jgi:uncharacterized protein (DUF58 family)
MIQLDINTIRQYGNIELLAKQLVEGFITGLHKSPYHGFSVEFAEHKIYNPGESTRYIDWKVFAKTDRLYTKKYEEETNLRCSILLDVSASMYYPEKGNGKIAFSIIAAAALAYMLQKQRDAVGLTAFSGEIEQQTPIKSTPGHLHKLFVLLEQLANRPVRQQKTAAAEVIHLLANSINKRSLVVIFSDMFETENEEDIFPALQHLKHNKHEVLIFHVTDKKTELNFEFEERPYEFIDVESGQREKVQPSQIKEQYHQQIAAFYSRLKEKCGQYKIDFIEADINLGIEQILLPYLIKRKKMV